MMAPLVERIPPENLMQAYCEGDERAFAALYGLFAPRLLGYLRALVREQAAAEDLLQLTFMKVHAARATYVLGADPTPWLYAIARRTCLDELRRRTRSRVRIARDDASMPEIEASLMGTAVGAEADEPYDQRQRERVLAALEHLPETQRDALVLTKLQGKSTAEAAQILGTTVGGIKLRAHRAYLTLREVLRDHAAVEQVTGDIALAMP